MKEFISIICSINLFFFNQNKHYLHNVDFAANICYNRNVTIVENSGCNQKNNGGNYGK